MSANDGKTELMPAVEDSDPSEIIPMHTSEHTAGYVDPQPTPVPEYLTMPATPTQSASMPLPAVPFLNGADSPPPGFQEFCEKWLAEHIPMIEAKAREYGSNSLQRKGERYARAQGRTVGQAEALQLALMQYCAEKVDRLEDASIRGLPASDDTAVDLAVYSLMLVYTRKYGRWM